MNNLGWLYQAGHGVPQDYAKAREWYEKAAAKDNAQAMKNLGWLYESRPRCAAGLRQGPRMVRKGSRTRQWPRDE